MSVASIRQTRLTILLSLNATAILIAGVLIAAAIWGGNREFRAVNERSDEVSDSIAQAQLIKAAQDADGAGVLANYSGTSTGVDGVAGWISSDPVKNN